MDLLGGYGSDASDDGEERQDQDTAPAPHLQATNHHTTSTAQPTSSSHGANGTGPSQQQMFARLPTPTVTEGAAKRVINFQLPLNRQMLRAPDSDEEEAEAAERRAKRLKAANKIKSKLMDYLPPPKAVTLGAGLGSGAAGLGARGGRGGMLGGSRTYEDNEEEDPVLAAGRGDGGAAAVGLNSNEGYRASEADEEEPYGAGEGDYGDATGVGAAGAGAFRTGSGMEAAAGTSSWSHAAAQYAVPSAAAAHQAQRQQAAADFELPPELAGVQFKEISGKDLRHVDPLKRQAASDMKSAMGVEYANQLRSQAASHLGSKLARSKHQIGTLYATAKMNEVALLEGKAHSMKTKSETQAKYGW